MLEKYSEILEFNRYSIISLVLIIVACIGGIAAATVIDNPLLLSLVVASTMSVETLILAVQSMKRIVSMSIISILVSILCMVIYMI